MAPPRKRKYHDSSDDELGFSQGLDSFGGERMARRLKRKGNIAPQTVPTNPVQEWDDDFRKYLLYFDPSLVADYGCENGVGASGKTRTHNVFEDCRRKGNIAPQTVPINPVEEWDADFRKYLLYFDPSLVGDYGCENGVGASGKTRTHNVFEDCTRKGNIAPQTVPINPVEEWDDDFRKYMLSFDPSLFADYGCENGVGVSGNTRTHNVFEDYTCVSSDHVSVESLDMDRDHNNEGFYSEEFVADAEYAPIHDVATDVDDDDGFIDDLDPQYKMFLANLVGSGRSYVLQMALGIGRSITVHYEPDDGPVPECNPVDVVDTPVFSSGIKTRKDMRSGARQGQTKPSCDSRKDSMGTQRKSSSIEKSEKAVSDHVAGRDKGVSERATPGLNNRDHQKEVSMVDPSYQSYLSALRIDGNETVFMCGINEEMLNEENEESTYDYEVIELNRIVEPIVICPDDDDTVGVQNESSKFRDGLMEILKKPYNQEEHGRLIKNVRHRRTREQCHRLRSGDKSYPTKFKAESYLDLHPDLQSQIMSAKSNKPKILNLLRAFFYWLKHVPLNGSFKPWLDASCLAVQPP